MQIILKMTTACNLNCVYCSEGDNAPQFLPKEIFYKLVDELPPLLDLRKTKDAEFLFHGGEPMLYGKENLKALIDYAKKNLPAYNVKFLMQTNGTLIDDDWINFFKAENISVGISLDGYPELHDKNRRTKNNEPTAEKILNNLQKLRAAGMNVGTLMVLNSAENLDADKLFDFVKKYDLQPKIHSVVACGRAKNRKDTGEVYSAWVELMKKLLARSLAEDNPQIIDPLDEIYNTILGIEPMRECSFNGSCGVNFMSLYPDGAVGFCGRDNSARLFIYGNLRENTLSELYNSANAEKIRARQDFLKNNSCKNCADWKFCHGGCSFEAVNFFGTLEAKYPHCAERKKFLQWLQTDGLKLVKAAFVREKTKLRNQIQQKQNLFSEIDNWKAEENGGT